ncbi:MAG: RNA 2'-phosphotransferase [Cyanobacteria bacterium J06648_16]
MTKSKDLRRLKRISKYLSLHLRHQPHKLGLTLAPGGWVDVSALLSAGATNGFAISLVELQQVVETNDKQRFAFDETGTRIRANQGHSVPVDLQLEPVTPPPILYHGTADSSVSDILKAGLRPMSRHHVHLSENMNTARQVGSRHGRPVVLVVKAASMHQDGYPFYRAANGVWLCDKVPIQYLTRIGPMDVS